jgi:tetratricopeptide (TPR) repeat protein
MGTSSKMKKAAPPAGFGRKFVQGLIIAFLVCVLLAGVLYQSFGWGRGGAKVGDPAVLAEEARKAIVAVRDRELTAVMGLPPRYDDIMRPLDQMIREAREKLESAEYDPLKDYDYIRTRTEPIPPIADAAYRQAMSEKTFLKKEYRFMQEKGDACRYWASALWNRLEAGNAGNSAGASFVPGIDDANRVLAILKTGLDGAPENAFLWYLSALVQRRSGGFAAARADLEKALQIDPDFIAAWNDLGLTLISLKEFGPAEEALLRAADLAEQVYARAGTPPGEDYVAALMNLADFHDSLASYYRREAQVNPTEENKASLRRHSEAAEEYAAKARQYTPYDPPGERALRGNS